MDARRDAERERRRTPVRRANRSAEQRIRRPAIFRNQSFLPRRGWMRCATPNGSDDVLLYVERTVLRSNESAAQPSSVTSLFFRGGDGCEARAAMRPEGILLYVEGRIVTRNEADAPPRKKSCSSEAGMEARRDAERERRRTSVRRANRSAEQRSRRLASKEKLFFVLCSSLIPLLLALLHHRLLRFLLGFLGLLALLCHSFPPGTRSPRGGPHACR